jgi:hypothetical protein
LQNLNDEQRVIPRLIHQTWHSAEYTEGRGTPASWRAHNPGWHYHLWLDSELDAFVEAEYPAYIELFRSYPNPVQRADLGRYLLLHRFGGLYADMDTDCLGSLEPLVTEDRIVLCEEPQQHWHHARTYGLERMLFNGTMASPAGHPFWLHLAGLLWRCRAAAQKDVLISTGPVLLTAAVQSWDRPEAFSLNSCHLFAPVASDGVGRGTAPHGDHADLRLSRHNWAGSWFGMPRTGAWVDLKGRLREARARLSQRVTPIGPEALEALDREMLLKAPPPHDPAAPAQVAIFVPVRDGARFLDRHWALIEALDWPRERLRLVYCEGDSTDDSRARLLDFRERRGGDFAGIEVLQHHGGLRLARRERWKPKHQLPRRSAIASVRNMLIRDGLQDGDDWVLWLDVDVCDIPPDLLQRLLAAQAKIVAPDCVLEPGGRSFDLNNHRDLDGVRKSQYFKHVRDGLFQPPATYAHRLHMHDMRFAERVTLTAVGGAVLLVHGSVHRAGLTFPERPYRHLIETEAFGRMAHDAGLPPIGLPQVEVRHVDI